MIGLSFLTAVNIIDAQKSSTMSNPKIEQFKKILQLDPKDETLWFGLGKAYMSDKNWGEAIPALEQCIQARPNYSAAYFALAQSLQQQEQFEKCRSVCVEGIAVATTNGDLLVIKNLEELSNSLPS
jgi:predicted Zn-dependent protease